MNCGGKVSLFGAGISGRNPKNPTLVAASCGSRSGYGLFLVTISTITHLSIICQSTQQSNVKKDYPKDQTSLFGEYFRSEILSGAIHFNGPVPLKEGQS
jgi:hypothetical protein